jgi:hypothetical protein
MYTLQIYQGTINSLRSGTHVLSYVKVPGSGILPVSGRDPRLLLLVLRYTALLHGVRARGYAMISSSKVPDHAINNLLY